MSGGPISTAMGDATFCVASTSGAFMTVRMVLMANACHRARSAARSIFSDTPRVSSMSCSTGVSSRGFNQCEQPQISTNTERNESWQPAVNGSAGFTPRTISHAKANAFAGITGRRRMMPPHTTHTITADRTADGRAPVISAYASKNKATAHAACRLRTPHARNMSHRNQPSTTRCCPEIART